MIEYLCQINDVEMEVLTFYPSSKICSCCGNIKKDLKLLNRIYRCKKYGLVIDRNFHASLNLVTYSSV